MNTSDFIFARALEYWPYRTPLQVRRAYDADNRLEYMGVSPKGKATSDAAWVISKYTYDANGLPETDVMSNFNVIWDDRASLFS